MKKLEQKAKMEKLVKILDERFDGLALHYLRQELNDFENKYTKFEKDFLFIQKIYCRLEIYLYNYEYDIFEYNKKRIGVKTICGGTTQMKYFIIVKANGEIIAGFHTYEEAKAELDRYEQDDKNDGIYEEDFYEIVEDETK